MDSLPHRLRMLREELGWSQREAAAACGITFGEWQSMETGRKARGLDEKIRRIADVSGYDPVWLMWGGPLDPSGGLNALSRCTLYSTLNAPEEMAFALDSAA